VLSISIQGEPSMLKRVIMPATLAAMLLPGVAMADDKMKMSMTQALDKVKGAGYTKIHEIERHSDHYHVKVYDQNCHKHHLKVLPNGKIEKGHSNERHPSSFDRVSALTIANNTKAMGYSKIKEIDLDFDKYHVKAMKDGHTHRLTFDAVTGKEMK
jgi:hypothetical protein